MRQVGRPGSLEVHIKNLQMQLQNSLWSFFNFNYFSSVIVQEHFALVADFPPAHRGDHLEADAAGIILSFFEPCLVH